MNYTFNISAMTVKDDEPLGSSASSSRPSIWNITQLGFAARIASSSANSVSLPSPPKLTLVNYSGITYSGFEVPQRLLQGPTTMRNQYDAMIDFAIKWQDLSITLSKEDSQKWDQIVLEKTKPGFPNF